MRITSITLIALVLLSACATPRSSLASGTVLYSDDFSVPGSGWDRQQSTAGVMDYDGGAYRILVTQPQTNIWSGARQDLMDTITEVDAGKYGGPDANRIGLICRSNGSDYYFFMISSDGYTGIGLLRSGKLSLLSGPELKLSTAVNTGGALNHLRFSCIGNQLIGTVNGTDVAVASDATLAHGDVALLAGTFEQSGADMVFDNFKVTAP